MKKYVVASVGLSALLAAFLTISTAAPAAWVDGGFSAASCEVSAAVHETSAAAHDTPATTADTSTQRNVPNNVQSNADGTAQTTTQESTPTVETESQEPEAASEPSGSVPYVWWCNKDYGGIAPEDGSLSEWAPHYYIAHYYGPYGQAILEMEPGDQVTVNDNLVTVEGSVVMRECCAYEDVMNAVGWDATVFQTCIPNSGDCRFVYARGASSTSAAADEARRWAGVDGAEKGECFARREEHAPLDEAVPTEPAPPHDGQPTPEPGNVAEPTFPGGPIPGQSPGVDVPF